MFRTAPGVTDTPLVSVVIPAFNAENTLLETLQSASAQTHLALEIIVVDDGSTDNTFNVAHSYRQIDTRVKVISKPNGGVASARNVGTWASQAKFVAFMDADDLWHPTKTAKQLALLLASGDKTALVYSPFRRIDTKGIVQGSSRNHRVDGWVINRHFYVNIVGNGSSVLIRKHVLEELGGYSSALLLNNAQGSEDMFLQLRIALRYRFATVPEYLVGYRLLPGNLSSDEERMLRSSLLAMSMVLAECPNFPELAQRGLLAREIWEYLKITTKRRRFKKGMDFIVPYVAGRSLWLIKAIWEDMTNKLERLYHGTADRPVWNAQAKTRSLKRHFYEYDPAAENDPDRPVAKRNNEETDKIYRNLAAMAPLDAAYRPDKLCEQNILSLTLHNKHSFRPGIRLV